MREKLVLSKTENIGLALVLYAEEIPDSRTRDKLLVFRKIETPYVFFDVVSVEGKRRVFFGQTLRHDEFKQAIIMELGKKPKDFLRGQVFIRGSEKRQFHLVMIHSIPEEEEALREAVLTVIGSISPSLLANEVSICSGKTRLYKYTPSGERLVKVE